MLFRLGGLFILCVFGAYALHNLWPFSALSPGAGLLFTLCAYVLLGYVAVRTYRRRASQYIGSAEDSFPPWPLDNSNLRVVALALIALTATLGLAAYFSYPSLTSNILASAAIATSGVVWVLAPLYAVRFGYFPSTFRGRGVSRRTDPLQFWSTFAMFVLFGALFFFFGIILMLRVIA